MTDNTTGVTTEFDTDAGYATVVISRPERRNALTFDMMRVLTEAIQRAGADPRMHAIVLTGDGAFCAGMDLDMLGAQSPAEISRRGMSFYDRPQGMVRALVDCPIPTIAALDGPAVGLGMDLALGCDSRFAGPDGLMLQGWGRIGLIPATGGVATLNQLNPSVLWRLLDGQPRFDRDAMAAAGLAEPTTGPARTAARARASNYGTMSRAALEGYVRLSRQPLKNALEDHLRVAAEIQLDLFTRGEFREKITQVAARPSR